MAYTGTLRRTPPLPHRDPIRHFSQSEKLPALLDGSYQIEVDLLPKPLFCRRITLPSKALHVSTMEIPSPMSSDTRSSPASSICSSDASVSSSPPSTPSTSAPSSPASRTRSLTYSSPPSAWFIPPVAPDPTPKQSLRRRRSPRQETLRSLRAKESDACLQRMCDQRVSAYLDGSMFECKKPGSRLAMEIVGWEK
ncbi:uncharacterized protein K460DRAFT_415126 [Cucurbitaria berberidis CBS 394.84]|uniref:Uncharacterized protein n=1 Tax=Cucurbitaria berberidis CBS 394.84 TaxID=1168544 RepID=A0A9P4LBQ5_9PLEO|nr:uncharacterized protein K460DRAFT_415126 [Cucurbitaria berberidis CBS 394.84]KAF1848587.1 hypothetical protein K460DRAFT_415126 [Cucurbitaria berberidis CBS 394.84]